MKKILIIDDDAGLVESMREILDSEGYSTLSASNGEDGFRNATESTPDLILLDVMMTHDREGFDVAKRLAENDITRKIPVIMITGIKKAKRLPFSYEPDEDWLPVKAVLDKPVDPDILIQRVRDALS